MIYLHDSVLSSCHILNNKTAAWKATEMSSGRFYAASAPSNGALWVTGGVDENGDELSTSDMVYPNGTVEPGGVIHSCRIS